MSVPSLKKRAAQSNNVTEDAFDEFQEDQFEEDGIEDGTAADAGSATAPSSQQRDNGQRGDQIRAAIHEHALTRLESKLSQAHYEFLSNRPGQRTLETLVQTTRADEPRALQVTIETVAKLRERGVSPSTRASRDLVNKVSRARDFSTVLQLLRDRTKYGLQIEDPRVLDDAFLEFTKPRKNKKLDEAPTVDGSESTDPEGAAAAVPQQSTEPELEQARHALSLLEVERFYLAERARDPAGLVACAGLVTRLATAPHATEQDKTVANSVLNELKTIGPEQTLATVLGLGNKSRKRLFYNRSVDLVRELQATGFDAEALKVAQQVQQGLSEFAPRS